MTNTILHDVLFGIKNTKIKSEEVNYPLKVENCHDSDKTNVGTSKLKRCPLFFNNIESKQK